MQSADTNAAALASTYEWSAKLPLNVQDSDLYPELKELLPAWKGATSMICCLLRYDFCDMFRHNEAFGIDNSL